MKADLKSELFSYQIDEKALKLAELNDGKLLLVTNVTDLTPPEIIARYKALADIECGFRVLKDEIEIGPIYQRIMRQRLKVAGSPLSPKRALQMLEPFRSTPYTLGQTQRPKGYRTSARSNRVSLAHSR